MLFRSVYLYDDHITLIFDINDGTTEDVEISMDEVEQSLCENVRLNSVVGHQTASCRSQILGRASICLASFHDGVIRS